LKVLQAELHALEGALRADAHGHAEAEPLDGDSY